MKNIIKFKGEFYKKILSSILCLAMCCTILCACGDSKDKDSNETTSAETTTEETTTEATTETIEDTTTETTTEVTTEETTEATVTEEVTTEATTEATTEEIVEETFNKEQAIAKVEKMIEAHDVLVSQNKEVENQLLNSAEHLNGNLAPDLKTSDNISIKGYKDNIAIVVNYYYNYVNNSGRYYDFENYVTNHTFSEIIKENLYLKFTNYTPNENILNKAIGLIPYIKQSDNIEYGDLVEENKITMEQANVAYSMTMKCDDNGGDFIAVYDIEGNLLNVFSIDDNWNGYITTF